MDKSIIITGANGGLGSVITRRFLDEKYNVTGIISPGGDRDFMKSEQLTVFKADLANEKEAEISLNKAINGSGPFSIGVFTVGGFGMGKLPETNIKDIRDMIQLNFETAYTSARILFDHFKKNNIQGRMIFIGARPGLQLKKANEMVAYGLSKSLVFALADIINRDGREEGISAAVVVPSIIDTPSNRKAMPGADFSKWVTPDSIADSILFLVSGHGMDLKDPVLKIYGGS